MNESLVKYLAGLLDADGSLSFAFRSDQNNIGRCFVGLNMRLASSTAVDKEGFIESLPALTGFGTVNRYGEFDQFKTWNVSKRADLEMLLPRIVKHMVIKAKHWQWLYEMWRDLRAKQNTVSSEEREALVQAVKESRRLKHGPLKPKNHPSWAWVAGYLDGDGCYSYRSHMNGEYRQWSIFVSAVAHVNDICVLEFLQHSFGGYIQPQGQSDNVKIWWRSLGYQNSSFALEFLSKTARHSRLKRAKIDAMIHHHRQRLSVPGTKPRVSASDSLKAA